MYILRKNKSLKLIVEWCKADLLFVVLKELRQLK